MWGSITVLGVKEWIVGAWRLNGEHIECGTCDSAGIQGVCQVVFVDQRTATGIDQEKILLR
ncbi:unnamed protein product, partial [marine sediment metagenome]